MLSDCVGFRPVFNNRRVTLAQLGNVDGFYNKAVNHISALHSSNLSIVFVFGSIYTLAQAFPVVNKKIVRL